MSYVKYREDDIYIVDNRQYLKYGSELKRATHAVPHFYDCKYCGKMFTDKKVLFNHIKEVHNIVQPLVLINGKVVSDNSIVQYVETAYINLYGLDSSVSINGKDITVSDDGAEIDITDQLNDILRKHKYCIISFRDSSITIEMNCLSLESKELLTRAIDDWNSASESGQRLSTGWLELDSLTDGDLRFLKGMYNYYLACRAEKEGNKTRRYDDAWHLLSTFHDISGVGKCVLEVISYRRNWINRLNQWTANENNDFKIAADYYNWRASDVTKKCDSLKQLYVEDETKISLILVKLFQQQEYDRVVEALRTFPDTDNLTNRNMRDQLNLLNARIALHNGNKKRANIFYEKINEPIFRELYRKHTEVQITSDIS